MKLSELKKHHKHEHHKHEKHKLGWHIVKDSDSVAGPFKTKKAAKEGAYSVRGFDPRVHGFMYGAVNRDDEFEEHEAPEGAGESEGAGDSDDAGDSDGGGGVSESMRSDSNAEHTGWYILKSDGSDKVGAGPYETRQAARSDAKYKQWYSEQKYDFAYGCLDIDDKFNEMPEPK